MFSVSSLIGGAIVAAVTYFFMKDKVSESKNLVRLLLFAFILGTFFSPFILIVMFLLLRGKNMDIAKTLGQVAEGDLSILNNQKSKIHQKLDKQYESGSLTSFERDLKKEQLDQKLKKMEELLQSRKKKALDNSSFGQRPFEKNPDQPFEIPDKDKNPFF